MTPSREQQRVKVLISLLFSLALMPQNIYARQEMIQSSCFLYLSFSSIVSYFILPILLHMLYISIFASCSRSEYFDKGKKNSQVIFYCRVHAYWTGNSVVSILSIKSAISEDTGNYSCILPNTGEKVTASLHILKGTCNFCFVKIWEKILA